MSSPDSINSKPSDLEKGHGITARENAVIEYPQFQHKFANPKPLGLLGFATSIFLISLFGVQPRGVQEPNVIIGAMIFFGGIGQMIAGIFELIIGETFPATVFCSFAGFNLSYALIFLPGSGIIAAYADPTTGALLPEFSEALAMFVWAWFLLCMIFTVASIRTNYILFLLLVFVDLTLVLIAAGHMSGSNAVLTASSGTGFVASFFAYWAGASYLMGNGQTPFNLPMGSLEKRA